MNIVELLKVIVFSLVEGFTEWLPISSTGHMILLQSIIPLQQSKEFFSTFEVLIQLGAVGAVIKEFFFRIWPVAQRSQGLFGGREVCFDWENSPGLPPCCSTGTIVG